jgi:dolichol-phosphate mannosyltransferase
MVSWFTRWVLHVPIRDASSGFRAVRLDAFESLPGPFAEGYAFQEDMLWRVHRAGGRLAEVPITFEDRKAGASKADFAESRRSIGELLHLARLTWLG